MAARCYLVSTLLLNSPLMRDIESIAVIGAGTMGRGIAQIAATAGYGSFSWTPMRGPRPRTLVDP
jgi:hypothetical protein